MRVYICRREWHGHGALSSRVENSIITTNKIGVGIAGNIYASYSRETYFFEIYNDPNILWLKL